MTTEIILIQEIEKHPCLYNFYMHEYNRKDMLDEAWSVVAQNCSLKISECKEKWKNIRSSFVRSLKTNYLKSKKPYYLTEYLQFVTPFLKSGFEMNSDEQRSMNDSNDDTSDEVPILQSIKMEPSTEVDPISVQATAENAHPQPTRPTKRKRVMLPMSKNPRLLKLMKARRPEPVVRPERTENNAMRLFLMSLLPEFDTMTEEQTRIFKIKVMMLINDIKTGQDAKINSRDESKRENDRLQKRLINLLLKNLEKNGDGD